MILYFANNHMKILGLATTHLPDGFVVTDDSKIDEVDTNVTTFEFTISYTPSTKAKLESMTKPGNYVLRKDGEKIHVFTILDSEEDSYDRSIYVYAEDGGLELLNEIVGAFESTEPQTAAWYINTFIAGSGFKIGINEISSDLKAALYWDTESTVTERIASVAASFGGFEMSFEFKIHGLDITEKYINIYQQRGSVKEHQLRLNRDIDRIVTKKSVINLATGLQCTGSIPAKKKVPITLEGYAYDDGDFYISGSRLYSREAHKKWSRYIWGNDNADNVGHIVKRFTYDTTDQAELCERAITQLKSLCDMEVNYEIDVSILPKNIEIGDRVNVVDDRGGLYLSARVLRLQTSITNNQQTATLGEYLIKSSGISQRVEELAAEFSKLTQSVFYTWIAYADDEFGNGISLNSRNKTYMGTAVNMLEEETDISDPSVFRWVKVQGDSPVTISIISSNGTIFKNEDISTVLTAQLYKNGIRLSDEEIDAIGVIKWYKDNDTTAIATGSVLTINKGDVTKKVTYIAQLED